MATFVILRHPVTILVTDFNNPDNSANDLLIFNSLMINKSLADNAIRQGHISCLRQKSPIQLDYYLSEKICTKSILTF